MIIMLAIVCLSCPCISRVWGEQTLYEIRVFTRVAEKFWNALFAKNACIVDPVSVDSQRFDLPNSQEPSAGVRPSGSSGVNTV